MSLLLKDGIIAIIIQFCFHLVAPLVNGRLSCLVYELRFTISLTELTKPMFQINFFLELITIISVAFLGHRFLIGKMRQNVDTDDWAASVYFGYDKGKSLPVNLPFQEASCSYCLSSANWCTEISTWIIAISFFECRPNGESSTAVPKSF